MAQEKACRKCRIVTENKQCPLCKGEDLTNNWRGVAIIINPDKSEIAKKLNVEFPGQYALKLR